MASRYLKEIRQTHGLGVPILVLTSSNDDQTKIRALSLGANDFLTKPVDGAELVTRVRNALIVKSHHDELASYAARLERVALIDTVTDVANRRAFESHLQNSLLDWGQLGSPFSVLLCDIDHFKRVNDVYGHPAGDALLRNIASRILGCVRKNDVVARFGGEEFAVILRKARAAEAARVAESIREAIGSPAFRFEANETNVTISIGASESMEADTAETIVQRADAALYESKAAGRNCCHVHDGGRSALVVGANRSPRKGNESPRTRSSDRQYDIKNSKIMIIDDEEVNVLVVKKHLKAAGYHDFVVTTDSTAAFQLIRSSQPDVVLLDIRMPHIDGLEILRQIRSDLAMKAIPVLILTSSTDHNTKLSALNGGANDFLTKPLDVNELVVRVQNSLTMKSQHDQLALYSKHLEREVQAQTSEIAASRMEAIHCLARAAECRDDNTGAHIMRVGKYAAIVADELGMDAEFVKLIECAAQLHDVGKIGIPDSILRKPGPLTDTEFDVMRGHASLGLQILAECRSPVMRLAASVAHAHHEKWDGSGYPRGLANKEIPMEARITALADVFDALSTARPYKDAIQLEDCISIIQQGRGNHFDPAVVDAFLARKSDIQEIYQAHNAGVTA